MNTTKLLSMVFYKRQKEIERYATDSDHIQLNQLSNLVMSAQNTEYGKKYDFNRVDTYQEFAEKVPLNTYDDLKPYIQGMLSGERDVLWEGGGK